MYVLIYCTGVSLSDLFHIAVLFIIARTWKQPGCPLTDEWIKLWYIHIHNGILLSHKKECIGINSNEVDEPRAYYSE